MKKKDLEISLRLIRLKQRTLRDAVQYGHDELSVCKKGMFTYGKPELLALCDEMAGKNFEQIKVIYKDWMGCEYVPSA